MQRYFSHELKDNIFKLNNDDLYHITRVMRMKENDLIEVVYEKEVYLCSLEFRGNDVNIKVKEKIEELSEDNHEIVLIIPLLKEAKMDLILQKATELGVSKIIPVIAFEGMQNEDCEGKNIIKVNTWEQAYKEYQKLKTN